MYSPPLYRMRTSEPTRETKSKRVPAGSTALLAEMPLKNLAVNPSNRVPARGAALPTKTDCVIVTNCGGGVVTAAGVFAGLLSRSAGATTGVDLFSCADGLGVGDNKRL
jgi:hypothetical protein